jgi:putative DNA primase/helicase
MAEIDDWGGERAKDSQDGAGELKRRPASPDSQLPESNNSIRPSRRRAQAPTNREESLRSDASKNTTSEPKGALKRVIPDHIRKRFVQIGHRYHFPDGAHAFTDRGARFITPSENTEVVKSLIAIAEARGWKEITVSGTDRFRKEAWAAASAFDIKVRGYTPTEFERAHLARKLAREGADEPAARYVSEPVLGRSQPDRNRPPDPIAGRLIDHGAASYRHEARQAMSYFVKIDTPSGEREIWGVDLKRALKESLTQPKIGEEIGLRAVRRDTVTVQDPKRDQDGKVVGKKPLDTHRNRWIVETADFFAERAAAARTLRDASVDPKQAARRHPELIGTYLQMHVAQIAARRLRDPQDRERFVSLVRTALADAVDRGEPLAPVRLKERTADRKPVTEAQREQAPSR